MHGPSPGASEEPRPDHESTDALTERMRTDAREATEALYIRLLPDLLLWVRLRKRSRSGASVESEDLVGEVWVRVLERLHEFDRSKGTFRPWVFGYAKRVWNEMTDPRRRLGRRLPSASDTALRAQRDSITTVTRAVARDELLQRLHDYVEALDPVDRDVYLMHGIEGMPCARVAEVLELSADAVSKRWQRLQARMRESGLARSFDDES